MIVTAQTLLDSAARLVNIVEDGESLTATESANGLAILNDMLESWLLQNFLIYAHTNQTFAVTESVGTYAIGAGQTWNTARPIGIRSGFTTLNAVDYPFLIIGEAEYNQISIKTLSGAYPSVAKYTASYPNAAITFWPVPAQTMTATLNLDTPLSSVPSLSTSIDLPPGYSKLLKYCLAVEFGPEFQVPVPETVQNIAKEVMGNIKVANLPDDVLSFDSAWSTGNGITWYDGRVL
jgi:hypothetical protein